MGFDMDPNGILANGETVYAEEQFDAELTILWDEDVVPITTPPSDEPDCETDVCDSIIYAYEFPHVNLHACAMTDQQTFCSVLMLANTQANTTLAMTQSV